MPSFDPLSRLVGGLAAVLGLTTAWVYTSAGLSLSHYDAKAHLVVARRIFDNLTPTWDQIGAIWLPLPHVLNAVPVQIDFMYRTGASAIALSIVSFAVTAACLSATVMRLTGSGAGAVLAASLFAVNPNVLYLQSTPMTEPLLFALSAMLVLHLTDWALSSEPHAPRAAGWTMVAACLTRYEAWPIVGAAIAIACWAKWRRGSTVGSVADALWRLALYPAGAVVFFLFLSKATIGEWFVTGGFFVPDLRLQNNPAAVYKAIVEGTTSLAGTRLVLASQVAVVVLVMAAAWRRTWSALVMPTALLAAAALPFYAYVSGHPFRIRYEVPLVLGAALAVGTAIGLMRRAAPVVALIVVIAVMVQVPAFDREAPMIVEAQRDRNNGEGRRAVTACLVKGYDGSTIMASMGALAHYMQELSQEGFAIRDFLHEGNWPWWGLAYDNGPAPFVGWLLIEEAAEGGDMLSQQREWNPRWLNGMERVCEGGNVALYRRTRA